MDNNILKRRSRQGAFLSLLGLLIILSAFIYAIVEFNSITRKVEQKAIELQHETMKLDSLKRKTMELYEELMITYGLPIDSIRTLSSSEIINRSISANDELKKMIKGHNPNNITVSYYVKTNDDKRLVTELEVLGYKFMPKNPSKNMREEITNAIWYGADVPLEDVKIVALALLRAGVAIKGIREFNNPNRIQNYKSKIIEIGASVDVNKCPTLSVEYIKSASIDEFRRNNKQPCHENASR